MELDLFTLAAQIVNFIILLVLLRLFLYKPVINAMNAREQKITDRLKEAEAARETAQREAEDYRSRRHQISEEREELLAEARREAEEHRRNLMASARSDADEQRAQWRRAVQGEKQKFLNDLQKRAEEQLVNAIRKALSDLADTPLERQMIAMFIRQLDRQQDELRTSLSDAEPKAVVRSTFSLEEDQRTQIRSALGRIVPEGTSIEFKRDRDLLCGIALETDKFVVGWNLSQYLDALENRLRTTLSEQAGEEEAMESA